MFDKHYSALLVDAHVHLHSCFDVTTFLNAAHRNLASHAEQFLCSGRILGILFLTEGPGENGFGRLLNHLRRQERNGEAALGPWRIHATDEDTSLYLAAGEERSLIVVAGQQISTQEQLEVLAVGTRQQFAEGLPIETTQRNVAATGALPIVPWGFGKWVGKRGELMRDLVHDGGGYRFFVGDNANRPSFLPKSRLLDTAEEEGIYNLPGSDPLPLPHEWQRVGQAGFILEETLDLSAPSQSLKEILRERRSPVRTFIDGETLVRFVRNQLFMQYRKFANRRRPVAR